MEWYREVQFVAAVPMPVEWAREYGTTVNGMRITRQQLAPGDVVSFGTSAFRFEQ